MIQIGLVEDNERYRLLIKNEIGKVKNSKLIIDASDGFELLLNLNLAKKLPDILLLDIELPKIDGLLLTSYISRTYPSIKIIGVSSHSNKALVTEVLNEGARSFISKHFTSPNSAIYKQAYGNRSVFREALDYTILNSTYIDDLLFNKGKELKLSSSTNQIIDKKIPELTLIQRQFLLLNAADLSYSEIALIMNKSLPSIKKYLAYFLEKFEVKNKSELITYCIKNGFVKLPALYNQYAN
ncbi:response regulator transcription factor [Sediminibacterium salmoneum]|uniref:response regulator transcription factor n=1 Tax=Sediminibacterium salmoneum TaxID=426421 RepID=UPI00047D297A|nr:response regulator transcription factor [Sediminibacterium salmoneum]